MKEFDVFISYAHADKTYVDKIYDSLSANGVRIFRDFESIGWGDRWADKIEHGLENCEFGIVVISKSYIDREWTEKELFSLLSRQNEQKDKLILPILYEMTGSEFTEAYPSVAEIQALRSFDLSPVEIAQKFVSILLHRMRGLLGSSENIPKLSAYTVDKDGVVEKAYNLLSGDARALLVSAVHYKYLNYDVSKSEQSVKELIQYGFACDSSCSIDGEFVYDDVWQIVNYIRYYFTQNPVIFSQFENNCSPDAKKKYDELVSDASKKYMTGDGLRKVFRSLSDDAMDTLRYLLISGGDFCGESVNHLPGLPELQKKAIAFRSQDGYVIRGDMLYFAEKQPDRFSRLLHDDYKGGSK